jgi:YD repeat-containing protein
MPVSKSMHIVTLTSKDFPKTQAMNKKAPRFKATFALDDKLFEQYEKAIALENTPFAITPHMLCDRLLATAEQDKGVYLIGEKAIIYANSRGMITTESDYDQSGRLLEKRIMEETTSSCTPIYVFHREQTISQNNVQTLKYRVLSDLKTVKCTVEPPPKKGLPKTPFDYLIYTFTQNASGWELSDALGFEEEYLRDERPGTDELSRLNQIVNDATKHNAKPARDIGMAFMAQGVQLTLVKYAAYQSTPCLELKTPS